MTILTNEELNNLEGGAFGPWTYVAVGVGVLIAGIVDGYMRPLKCN